MNPPLVLASSSPRRRHLLRLIDIDFEVSPSSIDERPRTGEDPAAFALRAAREKALDVAAYNPARLVLGADTVVEVDGKILGKPTSKEHAREMLGALSGCSHLVHTALALAIDTTCCDLSDTAAVRFIDLDDRMIDWYVACGEPMDKAGAYAIQGRGGLLVEEMRGSPHTVVGLPIHRLPELFASQGIDFYRLLAGRSRPGSKTL